MSATAGNTWTNSDGLYLRFGTTEGLVAKVGEFSYDGPEQIVEVALHYTQLPAFGAASTAFVDGYATGGIILDKSIRFPKEKCYIKSVEIETMVDWASSGNAITLDLGLIDTDGTTEYDYNGLVDAITQTELNACNGGALTTATINAAGWVGAVVGTVIDNTAKLWLTCQVSTATATAGQSVVRIRYLVPRKITDTLGTTL